MNVTVYMASTQIIELGFYRRISDLRYSRLCIIRICLVFLLLPVNACSVAQMRFKGSEVNKFECATQ